MSLTTDDIRYAAFLANAAYAADSNSTAQENLAGSLWQYVNPTALGVSPQYVDHGFFSYVSPDFSFVNDQALLAFNPASNTLAIAFRGTEGGEDIATDVLSDFSSAYAAFETNLIEPVLAKAALFGATRILVTGHSLGAAMAEEMMGDHQLDSRLVGVTFGSPGATDITNDPGSDPRLLNIGHADLYADISGNTFTTQGDPVFRVKSTQHIEGSDIRVDLPNEPDYNLWKTADLALQDLYYGQHEPAQYQHTANLIADELDKNSNDGHPFDVRAFSYVIGTDTTKITLDGSSGPNVIIGDGGPDALSGYEANDILDGVGGNDRLIGGAGDDIIYGGTGTDTVVYSLTRNQYDISVKGNSITVTAKGPLSFEGTDTVSTDATNGVEKFEFQDGALTVAQLLSQTLPPSDTAPPQLTGKLPVDNSTGVGIAANIGLTFNEPVFRGSGNIDIYKSDGSLFERIAIADTTEASFSGSTVTINPSFDLSPGTGYFIKINSATILDQSGNSFAGISNQTDFNFTTVAAADTSAPLLSGTLPSDNANGVSVGANIGLAFNEIVIPGSGNVDIHNSSGTILKSIAITDSSQVIFSNNTVTINPSFDLAAGSDYYVTVASGAIYDVAGNSFNGISSNTALNFTTASAPDLPPVHDNSIFLSVFDNSITEGNSGTKTLSLGVNLTGAGAGTQTVSVQYTTQDISGASSPATVGQDYIATSGILVIPAGQTSGHIDVTIVGDTQLEQDEVFRLALSQPSSNLTLLDSSGHASSSILATGFIDNDDQAPNHYPVTVNDIAITSPATTILMDVLSNDTDLDGDTLHISQLFSVGLGGTVPIAGNGTLSLSGDMVAVTPNADFSGIFSFGYEADDGKGGAISGYASVIVSGDGSTEITIPGTVNDDIITGSGGNDTLAGGFGDDIVSGGPGSDRIDGGPGFDYLDLRHADHGANVQLRDPWTFDDGDGGHDILTNIEGVLGTSFDDIIDGSSANIQYITTGYRVYGGDGNDRLQSDAGDDILDGGAGDDILIFGAGHDVVFGGTGNDQIYSFNGSSDTVGDTLAGGAGDDFIYSDLGQSPDIVTGGGGNDHIQFSDGDIVSGGAGADVFFFDGFSAAAPYSATITDLEPGDTIEWQFHDPVIIDNVAHDFIGPIHNGNGTGTELDHVDFTTSDGQTSLYFGFDADPGADFVLSIYGTFQLSQFQVDDSDFTLVIRVLPGEAVTNVIGGPGDDLLGGGISDYIPGAWSSLRFSDFNGDHKADLIDVERGGGSAYVWLSNGTSFGASSLWGTSMGASDRLVDLNGDGKTDVLQIDPATQASYVWLSTGTSFTPFSVWGHSMGTADRVADFNGDGKPDVIQVDNTGNAYVWTNHGSSFGDFAVWGHSMSANDRLIDLNGDGNTDVLQIDPITQASYVWLSTGTSFAPFSVWGHSMGSADRLADFNGDGKPDVIQVDNTGTAYVWTNSGASFGTFSVWGHSMTANDRLVDLNGDGKTDVLQIDNTGTAYAWLSTGTSFTPFSVWGHSMGTADRLADFNGDGKLDIIQVDNTGTAYVWTNSGTSFGNFAVWGHSMTANDQLVDLNGDGKTDVLQTDPASGNSYAWLSIGTSFTPFQVWGNNLIASTPGDDTLTGGAGNDTFIFNSRFGNDTVTDFTPGADTIELSQSQFADFNSVLSHTSDDGHGNTVIAIPDGSLTLDGILKAQLSAGDFHIV